MKIYTRTGDKGTTGLVGGQVISKADLRVDTYGDVDELNSYIGLLGDLDVNLPLKPLLKEIQDRLFTIGSNLASDPAFLKKKIPDILESDVKLLETEIDNMEVDLQPMRFFILPGGHQSISFGHIARTVCRRAERKVVKLSETEHVNDIIIIYLNRLSDFLFVLCRSMAKNLQVDEVAWKPRL